MIAAKKLSAVLENIYNAKSLLDIKLKICSCSKKYRFVLYYSNTQNVIVFEL